METKLSIIYSHSFKNGYYQRIFDGINYHASWFNNNLAATVNAIPNNVTAIVNLREGRYNSPWRGNIKISRAATKAARLNRSRITFKGIGEATPNANYTGYLDGGTIIEGGLVLFGNYIQVENLSVDCGYNYCNQNNNGIGLEGLVIMSDNAFIGDVTSKFCKFQNVSVLTRMYNEEVHCIYFEGVDNSEIRNVKTYLAGSGVVIKGSDNIINDVVGYGNSQYTFLVKSDPFVYSNRNKANNIKFYDIQSINTPVSNYTKGVSVIAAGVDCEDNLISNIITNKSAVSIAIEGQGNGAVRKLTIRDAQLRNTLTAINVANNCQVDFYSIRQDIGDYGVIVNSNSTVKLNDCAFLYTNSTCISNYGITELNNVSTKSIAGIGVYALSGVVKIKKWDDESVTKLQYTSNGYVDFGTPITHVSAADILQTTAKNGDIYYVTTTNAIFNIIGFWIRENGTWRKL